MTASRQANLGEFVHVQADQRRVKHGNRRQILQRIVQHLKQANEVQNFHAFIKAAALDLKRHVSSGELFCVTLGLARWRTEQNCHVAPFSRTKLLIRLIPDLMALLFQFTQAQSHQPRFLIHFLKIIDFCQRVVVALLAVLAILVSFDPQV